MVRRWGPRASNGFFGACERVNLSCPVTTGGTALTHVIPCPKCQKDYRPTPEQLAFIVRSEAKGMDFIMLECTVCYKNISYNPQHPRGEMKPAEPEVLIACPCKTCSGFVCYVDSPKPGFWGCGECGEQFAT